MADQKTAHQEWIFKRIKEVLSRYTAFEALHEYGYGENVVDQFTAIQMSCPFHGPDKRPSARYYPSEGYKSDYVRCYTCKENWNGIALYGKFRSIDFMPALKELERRFGIKIPRQPDIPGYEEPVDKVSAEYKSDAWADVPRIIALLEKKLLRLRDKAPLIDYIKFCRVLDVVQWDFDKNQSKATPAMIQILEKLRNKMDEMANLETLDD